ncbi:hypothetical protein ACFPRL_01210 [Pseudoclavibacter helvolus]
MAVGGGSVLAFVLRCRVGDGGHGLHRLLGAGVGGHGWCFLFGLRSRCQRGEMRRRWRRSWWWWWSGCAARRRTTPRRDRRRACW